MKIHLKILAMVMLAVVAFCAISPTYAAADQNPAEEYTGELYALLNVGNQGDVYYTIDYGQYIRINESYSYTGGTVRETRANYVTNTSGLNLVSGSSEGQRVWETSTTLSIGVHNILMKVYTDTKTGSSSKEYTIYLTVVGTITFDYNGGNTGNTTQLKSTGGPIVLPSASKDNATFDGWYTSPTGGTKIGSAGASWTPTKNTTLYAHYSDDAVQFLIGGLPTVATQYTIPYDGYMELKFQTNPDTAKVSITTNPTKASFTISRTGNTVVLAGHVSNVLPGTYYVILKATASGYTDATLTIQVNVATAIIEPLTDQIYIDQTWYYQITTIPSSATIQTNQTKITDAQGQVIPNTSYSLYVDGRALTFQGHEEKIYYINIVVSAIGYSPATKQIILNVIPIPEISGDPYAVGITATPNDQVDGGWYFTVNQPQDYHYLIWDFGDGTTPASEINVNHKYNRNGTFVVTCTLYNTTNGKNYTVSTEVQVKLEQQLGSDAWVETPYSYAILAPGTDSVSMTTDIDQSWLSIRTYEKDDIRYAELYSDTGPFAALANTDLTVNVSVGSTIITTFTIHIWPKIDESQITHYGFSLAAEGYDVTFTHTGSTVASYAIISWGDGYTTRISMTETKVHTYISANKYSVRADYIGNGNTLGSAFGLISVPSDSASYTITYDANGGSGSVPSSSGQSISVANNGFVWDGYEFLYWNTEADGTGTTYVPGALINSLTADLTLYAIWKTVSEEDGGDDNGNGGIVNKLKHKYWYIPLWIWIIIIILIAILIIRVVLD